MENIDFPQLVGPTYSMASLNADCQRCMNLQLETIESGEGANQFYLRETPGLKLVIDLSTVSGGIYAGKTIMGMLASQYSPTFLYVVIGYDFLIIDIFNMAILYTYPLFSSVNKATFPVIISENTVAIFVAPALKAIVNLATIGLFSKGRTGILLTQFNLDGGATFPVNYNGAQSLEFINNRFITIYTSLLGAGTYNAFTKFQISPIAVDVNGAWSAAEVYDVEGSIDQLVAIKANGVELWCFGTSSYEVFTDVGGANLHVFARIRDAVVAIGCLDSRSVQQTKGRVFWVSRSSQGSGIVYMSNGLNAERISTYAIELIITPYITGNPASSLNLIWFNCESWVYTLAGHTVYVLTLLADVSNPTLKNTTLAYDLDTGQWHELSYRNPITGEVSQHRGRYATNTGSQQLVSDHTLPYIYELSLTTYTDNGAPIIRYRRSPVLLTNNRRIFFKRLTLNMEVGVGLTPTATPATTDNPLISIRWSNDNAKTFGNYHVTSLGTVGKFLQQIVFNRLGSSLRRVFEVYFDAAVPFRIITAEIGISTGVH